MTNKENKNQVDQLIKEIESDIKKLNQHKIFEIYNSLYKLLGIQFLKGIAFGLGSVLGATIVVSIVVYFLAQIEFIPIIGDWVKHIIAELETN